MNQIIVHTRRYMANTYSTIRTLPPTLFFDFLSHKLARRFFCTSFVYFSVKIPHGTKRQTNGQNL